MKCHEGILCFVILFMNALELINLSCGYEKKVLFKNLNLTVAEGEKILLTGPNGCGKSTLLKAISGCLLPLEGKIITPYKGNIAYLK
ncbi:MAG: ATP-binding cassette domain-containing protein, partial [Sphaerochaetaceae bacterium]|nr:ATP-binding cassette domain-containing protein [Sphaerochaetaceae bacterium]